MGGWGGKRALGPNFHLGEAPRLWGCCAQPMWAAWALRRHLCAQTQTCVQLVSCTPLEHAKIIPLLAGVVAPSIKATNRCALSMQQYFPPGFKEKPCLLSMFSLLVGEISWTGSCVLGQVYMYDYVCLFWCRSLCMFNVLNARMRGFSGWHTFAFRKPTLCRRESKSGKSEARADYCWASTPNLLAPIKLFWDVVILSLLRYIKYQPAIQVFC